MFAGHYSVAFAARKVDSDVPLWVWFIAVQWLDLWFMVLVLAGVEKVRLVPGFTESNDLDLYYMPFSHGLVGSLVLSVALAAIVAVLRPTARRASTLALIALASFSHWILDLIVHTPDLALLSPDTKAGFGLWNHLLIEFPLELVMLAAFAWLYARSLPEPASRRRVWIVAVAIVAVQAYATFGPTPPSPTAFALTGLLAYLLLTAAARWVESAARPISSAP